MLVSATVHACGSKGNSRVFENLTNFVHFFKTITISPEIYICFIVFLFNKLLKVSILVKLNKALGMLMLHKTFKKIFRKKERSFTNTELVT